MREIQGHEGSLGGGVPWFPRAGREAGPGGVALVARARLEWAVRDGGFQYNTNILLNIFNIKCCYFL